MHRIGHDSLEGTGRGVMVTGSAFEKDTINLKSNHRTSTIYANCTVMNEQYLGDGKCDNYKESGDFNSFECGFDGGDCIEFNEKYPNCTTYSPDVSLGDGYCRGGEANTEECGFDGGDCIEFNQKYPNCTARYPEWIGDGECTDYPPFNTEECGFDGGDCSTKGTAFTFSTEVIVGIGVVLAVTGLGYLYFNRRRKQSSTETKTPEEPEPPLPQQYPDKKYHQPGGHQWNSTFAGF